MKNMHHPAGAQLRLERQLLSWDLLELAESK